MNYLQVIAFRFLLFIIQFFATLTVDSENNMYISEHFGNQGNPIYYLLRPFYVYDAWFYEIIKNHGYQYDSINVFGWFWPIFLRFLTSILSFLFQIKNGNLFSIIVQLSILQLFNFMSYQMMVKSIKGLFNNTQQYKCIIYSFLLLQSCTFFQAGYSESFFLFVQMIIFFCYNKTIDIPEKIDKFFIPLIFFGFMSIFIRSNGFLSLLLVPYILVNKFKNRRFIFKLNCFLFGMIFPLVGFSLFKKQQKLQQEFLIKNNIIRTAYKNLYSHLQKKYWDVEFMTFKGQRAFQYLIFLYVPVSAFIDYIKTIYQNKNLCQITRSLMHPLINYNVTYGQSVLQPYIYIYALLLFLGLTLIHFNSLFRLLLGYPITYIIIGVNLSQYSEKKRNISIRLLIFYLVLQAFLFGSETMPI